jgi:hypothetical protein
MLVTLSHTQPEAGAQRNRTASAPSRPPDLHLISGNYGNYGAEEKSRHKAGGEERDSLPEEGDNAIRMLVQCTESVGHCCHDGATSSR